MNNRKHKIKGNKRCLLGLLVLFFLAPYDGTCATLCILLFPIWIVENLKVMYILCEDILNDFPEEEYQLPKYFKGMARHRFGIYDKLPKCLIGYVYLDVILLGGYVIFFFINTLATVIIGRDAWFLLQPALIYIVIDGLIMVIVIESGGRYAAFLCKFKRLNRKNWMYLIKRLFLIRWRVGEPIARYQGKGVVVKLTKKRKKYYAEVHMVHNNQCIKHVFAGKKIYGRDEVRKIYEICGVRYLI